MYHPCSSVQSGGARSPFPQVKLKHKFIKALRCLKMQRCLVGFAKMPVLENLYRYLSSDS